MGFAVLHFDSLTFAVVFSNVPQILFAKTRFSNVLKILFPRNVFLGNRICGTFEKHAFREYDLRDLRTLCVCFGNKVCGTFGNQTFVGT